MKRSVTKTRKRRGGLKSKCVAVCNSSCANSCRNLCNVSKNDVSFHKQNFEELKAKKERLVEKLEEGNKNKVEYLMNKTLNSNDREKLKDIITSKDIDYKTTQYFLDLQKKNEQQSVVIQVQKQGGFFDLSNRRKDGDCENDCSKRCSESCEYLCGESIDKMSSMYKKEIKLLEEEIKVLEEVHKLIRVV